MCGLVTTEMSLNRASDGLLAALDSTESHKARPFNLETDVAKLAMLTKVHASACFWIGKVREMDIAAETKDLLGCVRFSRWFVKVLLLVADIKGKMGGRPDHADT